MHNKVTHSIMFHHFHSDVHPMGQGSISSQDFERMLDWLGTQYCLLSASDYFEKAISGLLKNDDICLSFDDALLCQYEVAVPILEQRNLSAFFFVYSSPLEGVPDLLEVLRFFRTTEYEDIDDFYEEFFSLVKFNDEKSYLKNHTEFLKLNYLKDFLFYSDNDKWFRYMRDVVMGKVEYEKTMTQLMESKNFDVSAIIDRLWINDSHLKTLVNMGHIVGLHSYSHPTTMHTLSSQEQETEYKKNQRHLQSNLENNEILSMAHPCGNYSEATLEILNSLGIKIGFRSSMSIPFVKSLLEIPREDHANVFKEMWK
ncbi:MAG: polysaccharide deacetylase family protein [Nitrospinaceae bacterium]|nr:polysaccharide deacetylase family protein [Nitrospinaceae bacterium]